MILDKVQKETWIYLLSQENLPLSEVDLFKLAVRWVKANTNTDIVNPVSEIVCTVI